MAVAKMTMRNRSSPGVKMTRRNGGGARMMTTQRRAVQVDALFKKKEAAAPAKKGTNFFGTAPKKAAPPKKKAAPAKKKKKAAPESSGGGLLDGVLDILGTNADTLEGRARSGSNAKGAQRYIGYRGSGQKGSAPDVDAQGNKAKFGGVVYRYGDKYKGNIDEFAPIFTPEERSSTGDTYAGGFLGLAIWFVGLSSLLAVGGYSIYATSALS